MRVLLVGKGAREHAIAWKLSRSKMLTRLTTAPGNAGTEALALGRNAPVADDDVDGLVRLAKQERSDLVFVGPEVPLALGLVDRMRDAGIAVFGPTAAAARIESSKAFAKDVMQAAGIPTGWARTFDDYEEAARFMETQPLPTVIKADGLAAGKGVVIAQSRAEAKAALWDFLEGRTLGAAGNRVLIEEYLDGKELSVFAFVEGPYVSPMAAACDYKRAYDGERGPNTGGMGSYSPPALWNPELQHTVRTTIMEPVARALSDRGAPFTGALYAGLSITAQGPKVIEFNCRLGDPEAQVVLPNLRSDLLRIAAASADGKLSKERVEWGDDTWVGVVVASGGYPLSYETGHAIRGLDTVDKHVVVFHAGTRGAGAGVMTDGGRVLTVTAPGGTVAEARRRAYGNVRRIRFVNAFYREDIAKGIQFAARSTVET